MLTFAEQLWRSADDDDDVIITNDGETVERVKKTVTSTSVPGHKDVEIIGGELKPPCQKQDARTMRLTRRWNFPQQGASEENVVERSISRSGEIRQCNYWQCCTSKKCWTGRGISTDPAKYIHHLLTNLLLLLCSPWRSRATKRAAATTTTSSERDDDNYYYNYFPRYTQDVPPEEALSAEAAVSEMRREDETQADRADAKKWKKNGRALNITSSTPGEVVQILREFVELTSPSNDVPKANIEEASFEVFNEKIIASQSARSFIIHER